LKVVGLKVYRLMATKLSTHRATTMVFTYIPVVITQSQATLATTTTLVFTYIPVVITQSQAILATAMTMVFTYIPVVITQSQAILATTTILVFTYIPVAVITLSQETLTITTTATVSACIHQATTLSQAILAYEEQVKQATTQSLNTLLCYMAQVIIIT